MSLLNQMLNDLDKRGSGAAQAEAVHPVARARSHSYQGVLLVLGMLLAGGAASWWLLRHRPPSAAPLPAHAAVRSKPEKVAASQVRAAVQAVAVSQVVAAPAAEAYHFVPASRFSFELSSIPLPKEIPVPRKPAKPSAPLHEHVAVASKATPKSAEQSAEGYAGPPIKHLSRQQQAQDEFGQALALIQQQRKQDAISHLELVLQLDPAHVDARRTLVGLLLELHRNAAAELVLQNGLRHDPGEPRLAMLLARLQVEGGAMQQALVTLQRSLPYARGQADYHAFMGAVLQRLNRNQDAVAHYRIALQQSPGSAVWWMGLGISLQAVDHDAEARDAFTRAAGLHKLSPQLQSFVEQRLTDLPAPAAR